MSYSLGSFSHSGLIVLNKPYGLRKESAIGLPQDRKKLITKHPAIDKMEHLSFSGILRVLSGELGSNELNLIKIPERLLDFQLGAVFASVVN